MRAGRAGITGAIVLALGMALAAGRAAASEVQTAAAGQPTAFEAQTRVAGQTTAFEAHTRVAGQAAASKVRTLRAAKPAKANARASIVGGTPINIAAAPWQVYVSTSSRACGGSILNATQVLTAAHCVIGAGATTPDPPSAFTVRAGVSNIVSPAPGDAEQTVGVAAIRVHPGYVSSSAFPKPDDVAVLQLKSPLNLGGAKARPIGLGPAPPGGTTVTITGFGRQVAGAIPNGVLYALATTVGDPLACGGEANALILCVASPAGSACNGDSGGPMTSGAALVGVSSFGGGDPPCQPGSLNGYANLAAPEIAAFVAGSDTPPLAPRGGGDVSGRGVFRVTGSVTCSPGTWSNAPTFTYSFVDNGTGAVLQSGPSATYVFTNGDLGRSVACHVAASNAGGTGIARTSGSPAIAPAPAAALAVSVRGPRGNVARGARMRLAIRIRNRGPVTARRVAVCARVSRGMKIVRTPRKAKRTRRRACVRIGNLGVGRARRVRVTVRTPQSTRVRVAKTSVSAKGANAPKRKAAYRLVARRG